MDFVKNLLGGIIIMAVATAIGVAQNFARGNPLTLFPKVTKPAARSTPTEAAPARQHLDASEPVSSSSVVTAAELAAGELPAQRLRTVTQAGTVILIDARSADEYSAGHIPGALNIPYEDFVDYYNRLVDWVPMDATVVAYCRSVTCDLSDNLAQELRLMGYERVLVYRGGWDEWSESGYPRASGPADQPEETE